MLGVEIAIETTVVKQSENLRNEFVVYMLEGKNIKSKFGEHTHTIINKVLKEFS